MSPAENPGRMSVTVVAPCRNEARRLERFLEDVMRQDMAGLDFEVIVADGMSDDGSREILARAAAPHDWIRVIDNPGRIVSTGLNAAIRQARGEIVIRMDVHTEYSPDYVKRCVETLEATRADNVGGPARTRAEGYLGRAIAAAFHSKFECGGAAFHDEAREGWVDTVPYGCWRKSTLERLGLFDERLARNQDDELNFRILRAGGRIWQSPAIVSWYHPRPNLAALFRQYFEYGSWKVAVMRKHGGAASWRHLVPGAFVLAIAGAAAALAFGLGSAPLAALLSVYALAALAASAHCAARAGWRLFPVLPAVFAVYHISYGLGFLSRMLSACPAGTRGGGRPREIPDRTVAALGLAVLAPVFASVAAAIALEDGLPVFFRQRRIGANGRPFRIWKFRTMRAGAPGTKITAAGDGRVTRVGAFLRRYKLDELPQLWNVLRGEMSLVGPRPEVPDFVDLSDPAWRAVLGAKPGITDPVSILYRDEEQALARARDPERHYRDVVLPSKLELTARYLARRSFRLDLKVVLLTLRHAFLRFGFDADSIRARLL